MPSEPVSLAIRGTTVIDVSDGSLHPDRMVLIEGNRIAQIGGAADVEMPTGATVLDGAGTYLIPGLWDMHAHAVGEYGEVEVFFALLIANGVTGIRDPSTVAPGLEAMVGPATRAGLMPGPVRIIAAGNLVDGAETWPWAQVADSPERGRFLVDSLAAVGVPFIKVYSRLAPATYFAIAERAREIGMPFVGHVPVAVSAADASDRGQRSIEHFTGVMLGCTAVEEQALALLQAATRAAESGDTTASVRQAIGRRYGLMRSAPLDEARCRDLLARFADNGTWQVPTLATAWGFAFSSDSMLEHDERMAYVPPTVRSYWTDALSRIPPFAEAQFHRQMRIAGLLEDMHVPLLVGTDMPAIPMTVPGLSVHRELELLVEAGLSPLYVLQAATLNPARFFGMTDSLGTVEEGNMADLLLLEANPLEDISNTRRIRAVIANGQLYRREQLDSLLADVAAANSRPSLATLLQDAYDEGGLAAARARYIELRDAAADSVTMTDWGLIDFAHSLLTDGQEEHAAAAFGWAVRSFPKSSYPYGAYGAALARAGRVGAAAEQFRHAVEIARRGNHPGVHYFRRRLDELTASSAGRP